MGFLSKIEAKAITKNTYSVYIMDEKYREDAGHTVPTQYALNRSENTGKKITLSSENLETDIYHGLKKESLIPTKSSADDIEYDGDLNNIGVWYKGSYLFTLIAN